MATALCQLSRRVPYFPACFALAMFVAVSPGLLSQAAAIAGDSQLTVSVRVGHRRGQWAATMSQGGERERRRGGYWASAA